MTLRRPFAGLCCAAVSTVSLLASANAGAVPSTATTKTAPHSVRTVLTKAAGLIYAGHAVAVDADTVAVGARDAVELYPLTAGTPTKESPTVITAPNGSDDFGKSVALDGNTLVVGAEDSTEGSQVDAGSVYIFQRGPAGWKDVTAPVATLVSPNPTPSGYFGFSVAVQGGTVVVGAPVEAGEAGVTYVFTEPVTGWAGSAPNVATLSSPQAGSAAGHSVAIDGNTVVAGASNYQSGTAASAGAVAVYAEPTSGGWKDAAPTRVLTDRVPATDQLLGLSVAISGQVIVAGGPSITVGRVDVYVEPSGGWTADTGLPTATIVDSGLRSDSGLGASVAIDGSQIVAGAPSATVSDDSDAGVVDEFTKPASGWDDLTVPSARVSDTTLQKFGEFGTVLAAGGSRLVVGTPYVQGTATPPADSGAAYLYTTLPVPSLTSVKQSYTSWKPDTHLPKLNPKKAYKTGTAYRFTANQAMPVDLRFAKRSHGHYGKTKVLTEVAKKGKNVLYFGSHLTKARKLSAGKYRVVILAENATGDKSAGHTLHFTIR